MLKKMKSMFIVGITVLFLLGGVGCSTIGFGIEKNDTTEFVIKQVSRGLGYKVSDQNPDSICDVKKVADEFIAACNSDEYAEEGATAFANMAIKYIMGEVNLEDVMLQKSLEDLAEFVEIDLGNIQINDDNIELLKIAVNAYLEGLEMVREDKSITCDF